MRIFVMECLKMCVVVGLALTAAPGRPAAAAPSPTNAYVYQQHKRSPVDPNLDLTSGLTTDFGGFGPSSTLPDFGSGSGFPSTTAGFGFDDATAGFGTSAGLLHLSHPYAATAFGSGLGSVGYPFSESTLNQLQFKSTLASSSSPSLPVSVNYSPSVPNVGLHHTRITGFPATENSKLTAQSTVSLQQTRPNEQRVTAELFKAIPAPLQQLYSASASSVPQQQTYAIYAPLKQSYPTSASVPQRQSYPATESVLQQQQQSYPAAISVPLQQSYPATASAPLQQSYPAPAYVPQQQQQSYPAAISVPLQQSYPATASAPLQQLYVTAESVPQRQSYSLSGPVPQQQSYSNSGPVPQQQSYSNSGPVPQKQSYSSSGSAPLQQSYPVAGSVQPQQSYSSSGSIQQQSYSNSGPTPQQQSYSLSGSVPQQQSYSSSGSAPLQQSYPATGSVQQQQPYQTTLTEPLQQTYIAATSNQPEQSYPTTSGDFRSSVYQLPAAGSTPDLILELRPPPYTAPASSVDYRQNVNIPSTLPSSYQPPVSNNNNNNYPSNDFGLLTAPVAGTSGLNQVSNAPNGGPLPGNTNNFLAVSSNAKPDQTPLNTYYTVPLPVSGGSNSASNDVPNFFSIPNIAYSLTSSVNSEFSGSTKAPPAAPVSSIGTDRGVPAAAANPTGGPSLSYRDANIPSVSYPSSNSISANSYSDSNSIQSSSYTIPSSPVAGNSYSNYKLNTDSFYVDSNSISPNSKRESSTVNSFKNFQG
ncbi:nuclear pore complex protein NUP62-like [Myzus persicae]|uniref:nuclear pore complex protein NUP62-like n=1 Tax=Myzus persicae TaxID=13164 RepID=UPI000B933238|nr:nuclear pore complex protein NUP62-like [Myzus persicae]